MLVIRAQRALSLRNVALVVGPKELGLLTYWAHLGWRTALASASASGSGASEVYPDLLVDAGLPQLSTMAVGMLGDAEVTYMDSSSIRFGSARR